MVLLSLGMVLLCVLVLRSRQLVGLLLLVLGLLLLVAGQYALLGAEFLAAAQVLVYAGGVVVLLALGLALGRAGTGPQAQGQHNRWGAGAVALAMLGLLGTAVWHMPLLPPLQRQPGWALQQLGQQVVGTQVLPFEVLGLLLLLVLVGASHLASGSRQ